MTNRLAASSCGQLTASTRGEPIRVSICHYLACQKRNAVCLTLRPDSLLTL
jgi:hypothetical protein